MKGWRKKMKMKGRMMLLLTLIVAVALSAISYKGIGSKKALSVHRIEQGLDLSGGVESCAFLLARKLAA